MTEEASEACKVHTEDKLQRHADCASELQEQVSLLEGSLATALSASELQAAATTELQQSCETLAACKTLAVQNHLSIFCLPEDHLQEQMHGLQSDLRAETEAAKQQRNSETELKDGHRLFNTFSFPSRLSICSMPTLLSKQDLAERQHAEILELRLRGSLAGKQKLSWQWMKLQFVLPELARQALKVVSIL